jgi:hypothetical protein
VRHRPTLTVRFGRKSERSVHGASYAHAVRCITAWVVASQRRCRPRRPQARRISRVPDYALASWARSRPRRRRQLARRCREPYVPAHGRLGSRFVRHAPNIGWRGRLRQPRHAIRARTASRRRKAEATTGSASLV